MCFKANRTNLYRMWNFLWPLEDDRSQKKTTPGFFSLIASFGIISVGAVVQSLEV